MHILRYVTNVIYFILVSTEYGSVLYLLYLFIIEHIENYICNNFILQNYRLSVKLYKIKKVLVLIKEYFEMFADIKKI